MKRTSTFFSKRKFLSFSLAKQHKKCYELLRDVYCYLGTKKAEKMLAHYHEIQLWMNRSLMHTASVEEISDRFHQHLQYAKCSLAEHDLLPRIRKGDKRFSPCNIFPVGIYLEKIRSAHNVGSILRTIEAFSLGTVFFHPETPFVDHPQVQKTSMGTYNDVFCRKLTSLNELPRPLILLETSDAAIPIKEFHFPKTFTLVLGNEEYGCSCELTKVADHLIEIPLRGRKNSLNVANAFAIAAAEIAGQLQAIFEKSSTTLTRAV